MRRWLVVVVVAALGARARADVRTWKPPGRAYEVDWSIGGRRLIPTVTVHNRSGHDSIDSWFQIAADASAVAMRFRETGVAVYTAAGKPVLSRAANVNAFRLSPDGAQVAIANPKTLEIISLASPDAPRPIELAGVSWLGFAHTDVIARIGDRLAAIDASGAVRTLLTAPRIRALAIAGDHLAYVTDHELVAFELAHPDAPRQVALPGHDAIVGVELSPDGKLLLCMSAEHIFSWDGTGAPQLVATAHLITTIAFEPDGSWVWSSIDRGAIVNVTGSHALPTGYGSAQLQAGGTGIVAISDANIIVWEPATGGTTIVGKPDPAAEGILTAATVRSGLVTFRWLGGLCYMDPEKCMAPPLAMP